MAESRTFLAEVSKGGGRPFLQSQRERTGRRESTKGGGGVLRTGTQAVRAFPPAAAAESRVLVGTGALPALVQGQMATVSGAAADSGAAGHKGEVLARQSRVGGVFAFKI